MRSQFVTASDHLRSQAVTTKVTFTIAGIFVASRCIANCGKFNEFRHHSLRQVAGSR